MAEQSTKFCENCNKQVLVTRPSPNHILHLLLSIVTGGLWIVVWVLSCVSIGGWRCTQCGTKTSIFE